MERNIMMSITTLITLISCNNVSIHKNQDIAAPELEKIEVQYWQGMPEFYKHQHSYSFKKRDCKKSDTIYVSDKDFETIKEYVHSKTAQTYSNYVDVRMAVYVDSVKACFGLNYSEEYSTDSIMDIEYLIKRLSGYYNYLDSLWIGSDWFPEIKKNGIPQNYHYIKPENTDFSCVVLIKKGT